MRLVERRAELRLAFRGGGDARAAVDAEQLATILVALQVGDLVQPGLETGERSGIALALKPVLAHDGVEVSRGVVHVRGLHRARHNHRPVQLEGAPLENSQEADHVLARLLEKVPSEVLRGLAHPLVLVRGGLQRTRLVHADALTGVLDVVRLARDAGAQLVLDPFVQSVTARVELRDFRRDVQVGCEFMDARVNPNAALLNSTVDMARHDVMVARPRAVRGFRWDST